MAGWWYLRRAIPWVTLLACGAAALAAAGAVHRWPSTAAVLLPAALGCCAAAAAFVFDEREWAVTAVTPRAAWRRWARLGVALLPLGLWSVVVMVRPGDVPIQRPGWWLIGAGAVLVSAGAAAVASRRRLPAPGSTLAGLVAMAVFGPLLVGALFGLGSLYPFDGFPSSVWAFWGVTAGVGATACVAALRPA